MCGSSSRVFFNKFERGTSRYAIELAIGGDMRTVSAVLRHKLGATGIYATGAM